MLDCTIGIMAYNEEANIGKLLDALLSQKLTRCRIKNIFVVASGCTDRTEEIVKEYMKKDTRIVLLTQATREGKASAINLFLSHVDTDIVVLESADTIPMPDTIEKLVMPFTNNPEIGMSGAHPVPVDDTQKFIGFTTHLLWNLHHELALRYPKLGELIAFRKDVVSYIPKDTITDEACLEAIFTNKGYKLQYVPEAIVRNKGQGSVKEYIIRRRNLYAGHIQLVKRYGYAPSTMNIQVILRLILKHMIQYPGIKNYVFILGAMVLEVFVRILGMYDYYIKNKKGRLHIWEVASTSKKVAESG